MLMHENGNEDIIFSVSRLAASREGRRSEGMLNIKYGEQTIIIFIIIYRNGEEEKKLNTCIHFSFRRYS